MPGSAHAHDTEGIAALLLAVLAWPVVVVACTLLARRGRRLVAFILSITLFPISAFFALSIAQSSGQGASLVASIGAVLIWLVVVAAMGVAAVERKRARRGA